MVKIFYKVWYKKQIFERQRRRFFDGSDCMVCVQLQSGYVVTALDKELYYDYLCLVSGFEQVANLRENKLKGKLRIQSTS